MGFSYYVNSGTLAEFFTAAVDLPAGAHVTELECSFNDTSGTANAEVKLQKSVYVVGTGPSQTTLATVASADSDGFQEVATTLDETLRYRDGNNRVFWYLSADMPADTAVRLRGCRLTWNRQITPPPGAATFNDVGTGHQQFQFVEALVAAGITSGCGNNNYCPDAPLTRGQMAVFMARLVGLHWPN
jgi:hypothetical protein